MSAGCFLLALYPIIFKTINYEKGQKPQHFRGNVFIDLRLDYAFHLTFGKPGNEDLLLMLVNAILPQLGVPEETIVQATGLTAKEVAAL